MRGLADSSQSARPRKRDKGASRYRFAFKNGVLVGEKAPRLELRVTASDSIGNNSMATALPVFGG